MNIDPNNLFPNPQFFEIVFQEIINNPTLNLREEENEDENFSIRFQSQPPETQPIPPIVQRDNAIHFQINEVQRRRGRVQHIDESQSKRIRSYSFDNLIRKIFYNFITFSIRFCNDALEEENLNIPFSFRIIRFIKPIFHGLNLRNFNLKEKSIKDILKLDLTRRHNLKDANRKLLEKVETLSPRLSNLFEMNFLELFKYYYNNEKPLNKITFENKEIYLSPRTKTFYDLLEAYKDQREDIIYAAKKILNS